MELTVELMAFGLLCLSFEEKQTTCWKRTTELNRRLHLQQLERQMFPCGAATEPEGLMGCRIEMNQVKSSHMVRWVKLALQNCHTLVAQVCLHSSGKKKAISSIFFPSADQYKVNESKGTFQR